jgi:hypothetical protein
MTDEVRAVFFLVASLVFFLFIVGILALGAVLKPGRWSERPRVAS